MSSRLFGPLNMFNELPGAARHEFNNDPATFLKFVQDPKNADKLEKLGLAKGIDGLDVTGAPINAPLTPSETKNALKDTAPQSASEAVKADE